VKVMRRIFRTAGALGLSVLLAEAAALHAASGPTADHGQGVVTLRVYDAVSLPADVMDTLRDTAVSTLAGALTLRWLDCTLWTPRNAGCDDRRTSRDVVVRVMAEHASPGRSTCGFALTSRAQRGFISLAYECAVRGASAARTRGPASDRVHLSAGEVLGYVLAHELAHVLMPGVPHSDDGLFSAHLGHKHWKRHQQGWLAFSPADMARLREAAKH
jgi:hypothetical protein